MSKPNARTPFANVPSSPSLPPTSRKRLRFVGSVAGLALLSVVALFWLVLALPSQAQGGGTIFYVTTGGAGTACTQASPCPLQTAVDAAGDGDDVRVAKGTYTSNTVTPTLQIDSKTITVTGGYDSNDWSAEPDPLLNETILDGGSNGRVVEILSSGSTTLSGFTIRNGFASQGAGVYNESGTPTLRQNRIHDNDAQDSGGGIYDGGSATIVDNEIFRNQADLGGGIATQNENGNTTIRANQIYSNTATSRGGGIFLSLPNSGTNRAFVEGNIIHNNTANTVGGGVSTFPATSITLQNNLIYENNSDNGGGVHFVTTAFLWNNTVVQNDASSRGGGIFVEAGTTTISNTIVVSNTGGTNSGIDNDGTVNGDYNNIFGNTANVNFTNEINSDPLFLNPTTNNYHLSEDSPNRNAGDPDTDPAIDTDIDGQQRPNPGDSPVRVDIGADEFYPSVPDVAIIPETLPEQFEDRGTTPTYDHAVENAGAVADSYALTCDIDRATWGISCDNATGTLQPGQQENIQTTVTIPGGAGPFEEATAVITATSNISPEVFARAIVPITVNPIIGISFTPNYSDTLLPGEAITFTHSLTNTGDYTETFNLSLASDPLDWAELLPSNFFSVDLAPNEATNVDVRVVVPDTAAAGLFNPIEIEAGSDFDPQVTATVINTVTARATVGARYVSPGGDDLNNNCTQSGSPCQTVGHAVGQASSGDEIRLRTGSYIVDEINVNDTVHIEGGWNSNFKSQGEDPSETIIQGTGASRLFNISSGSSLRPTFNNVTLRDGNSSTSGGAVLVGNFAQPQFSNTVFQSNQSSQGGAIFVGDNALAVIKKSRFISNTGELSGGAIYNSGGTVFIAQTSFLTNTTTSSDSTRGGGAIFSSGGLVEAENSLFHNNASGSHGGAIRAQSGTVELGNVTMVNNDAATNGGGIYNGGATAGVVNTIFAGNTAVSGGAVYQASGTTDVAYSDVWNNTTPELDGAITTANNISGDPLFVDSLFHLGEGSPAVDAGDPATALAVDFEDDFRPSDQGHDIGYDELAGCLAKRGDVVYGSIQDAIDAGSADDLIRVSGICRGVNTIQVNGDTISQTVHLAESLHIQGGWRGDFKERDFTPTYVDPEGRGRGFYVSGNTTPIIESLIIRFGDATGLGGGPADEDAGGGIYNLDSQAIISDVAVLTGTAELGGGFYNHTGTPRFTNLFPSESAPRQSRLVANTATRGGGFYNYNGAATVDGLLIQANVATDGGGIYNDQGTLTAVNLVLSENEATGNGGGAYNAATASSFWHLTVYSNTAGLDGGGFYNAGGSPVLRSNIFQSNRANSGPAVFVAGGTPDADYNYYHDHASQPVVGIGAGPNSIISTTPPGLLGPGAGDYHLAEGGAAVDQGDPAAPVVRDFDGDPRPSNQGPDMGADEVVGCLARVKGVTYGSIQVALDAADPGDTIRVAGRCTGVHPYDAGVLGTIYQTVHVAKNVTLEGGWRTDFSERDQVTELDALNQGRVIYVGPGITATVDGFDIFNGDAGANGMDGNGGAIYVDATAAPSILDNQIYSNTATSGAGVYVADAEPRIDGGNRFFNNNATDGGAVYVANSGSQIAAIQNNFIYSNTAVSGAGIYNSDGPTRIWHNTILSNTASSNGGGLFVAADTPDVRSNIVGHNTASSGGGIHSTPALTLNYNDFYANSSDFGGSASAGAGQLAVDPNFANPAGFDFTIPITSPVVDKGDPSLSLLADFEDDIRPSHQGFDMGADEVGGCFVRNLSDPGTVYGNLQLVVDAASSGDTIQVDGLCQNVNTRNIGGSTNVTQTLFLDKLLTIDGDWDFNDTAPATLNALERGRVAYIASSTTVTLTNIHLRSGNSTNAGLGNNGGGLFNTGTANLIEIEHYKNQATNGGGIYNDGELTLRESKVYSNTATGGAGLYNNVAGAGQATLEQNEFFGNEASGNGGGLFLNNGILFLDGNELYENSAVDGGGVYLSGGTADTLDVRNNFIYANSANRGGGVFNNNTDGRIWHNTLVNNIAASGDGGGIFSANSTPDIRDNIIDSNTGSGIHISAGTPTIDYNNVYNNTNDYTGSATPGANDISAAPVYRDPAKQDYHLDTGSPGIDAGIDLIPNDIDGDLRPTNKSSDMGADEVNLCLVRVGNEIFGVLQDAIDYAEANNISTVEIARGECSGVKTRNGAEQVAYITEDLQLLGSRTRDNFAFTNDYYNPDIGAVSTSINAEGEGRVIVVASGATVSLEHMALVNGNGAAANDSNDNGGGLYNAGSISMQTVVSCQNTAVNGGAYYGAAGSDGEITGAFTGSYPIFSIIEFCDVARFSLTSSSPDNVTYVYFDENTATTDGGGFYVASSAQFEIRNHGILGNVATNNGGGVYTAGNGRIINGVFHLNDAQNGGAAYNNATLEMFHNTINTNNANDTGGGVYNNGGTFVLNSSIVVDNTSTNGSSGVHSTGGSVTHDYNNFHNNSASFALGANSFTAEPLISLYEQSRHSPTLDRADPALLVGGNDPFVDFDADNVHRPDGHTYAEYTGLYGYESDVGADEYIKDFGCDIEPNDEQTGTILPGETISYTFTIFNSGFPSFRKENVISHGYTDTITITLTSTQQDWVTFAGGTEQVVEMDWFDSVQRVLTVTVPSTATTGIRDTSTVKCQSASLPTRTDTAKAVTNAGIVNAIEIAPSYVDSALPGDVITYTHNITNAGNSTEDFEITPNAGPRHANAEIPRLIDDTGTIITDTDVVTLEPSETITVLLRVTILGTASAGETATPGVVVNLASDPQIFNSVLNQISIGFISGTRYVAATGSADNTNCTDPVNPCATTQHAHDQAVDGDTVLIAKGTYTDTITATVGSETLLQNLYIDKSITIRGGYDAGGGYAMSEPITNAVVFSGEGQRRVIYVSDGVTVSLQSLFIQDGAAGSDPGGGLYNAGASLTISGAWVLSNTGQMGGGLYHAAGALNLASSVLAHNSSTGNGGGLYVADGAAWLENDTFADNQASSGNGGGLYQAAGTLTLYNAIFADNAGASGSAAWVDGAVARTNDYNLYFNNTANFTAGSNSISGSDPLFADSFYHIASTSPAKDTGTESGTRYTDGVDFELEPRRQGRGVDMGADERFQRAALAFTPTPLSATIDPGETAVYTHTLTNTGDFSDTYSLSLDSTSIPAGGDWSHTLTPNSTFELQPGESITVILEVTGSSLGYMDETEIIATAQDAQLVRSVLDTTTVRHTPGVDVEADESGSGGSGDVVTYTHTLTNTGDGPDDFLLSVDSATPPDWVVTVTPTQTALLSPTESIPFTVTVTVPGDALSGTMHTASILAEAVNPDASDTLTDTTTVTAVTGLTLVPTTQQQNFGSGGVTAVYTHTLTNEGNVDEDVTLTHSSSPNWTVTTTPPDPFTLPAFGSTTITVTVDVPAGANDVAHTAVVTATGSSGTQASAADTTIVGNATRSVVIAPDNSDSGAPGDTVTYQHTVTNTGNLSEDFTLTTSSSLGWATTVTPDTLSLNPGEAANVTVQVTIPGGAGASDVDTTTVTVTSSDDAVSDTATDTTSVTISRQAGVELTPDQEKTVAAGTTAVYTHTLTNTGNGSDTFTITARSNRNWPITTPTPVTLDASNATIITVTMDVPGAAGGSTEPMVVTATSSFDPAVFATATNTTTVTGESGTIGVAIGPDNTGAGDPGATVQYQHAITNTGDITETFRLSVDSSQGWGSSVLPEIVPLAPGESGRVEVSVVIPDNAVSGTVDTTMVTVSSLTDSSVNDSATDTTTAKAGKLYLPLIAKQPSSTPPPTPTPTPTATATPPGPTATPVGCPTGIDLIVTEIRVEPATPVGGEAATVHVTIENQGTSDVPFGNNFYLDFYVDRTPAPLLIGNIAWGIQGRLLDAGASVTYSAEYTFDSGEHQLWAQVDTDDTVEECTNETNNVLGPEPISVSGSFQSDATPPARIIPSDPRTTPTPDTADLTAVPVDTVAPLVTPTPSPTLTPSVETTVPAEGTPLATIVLTPKIEVTPKRP